MIIIQYIKCLKLTNGSKFTIYFYAILTRKNFNEVIEDNDLTNYLENNYIADGNKNYIVTSI